MKMGKKVREYKAGDFIFAKVKGYPAWPARVQRMNGKKYFVYFYGTGEIANLPPNMIFDYAENKDKFLAKPVKRRDFNEGVKQIEYDFANNVPLEQVIGVAVEAEAVEGANDTANETVDDSMADTTAADETMADETTQNDTGIDDSDETGALVIDEGKQAKTTRKSAAKTPAKETPKAKEAKTPRGRAKKDEESKEEVKEDDKKEEELVSRSGRKIRPKRYIDEQTEENTTLPSPAPKKRRGTSPVEKDKENKEKDKESKEKDNKDKNIKHFNAVTQAELQDLKEPFAPEDPEKENIIICYLPTGQYVGVRLFQSRPDSFKNDAARLQWDKQAASNALTLKSQLEKGHITPQSVMAQLVTDLNLTDEEKATLDKDRDTEEKKSQVQYLKTEMKLMELDTKIKTCLCLEKADTELCLKILDELIELNIKPLMLLKHPNTLETIKRMRAYVGNSPSWELNESEALQFSQQALKIRKRAEAVYNHMKELFSTPEGLSFWEFFTERVAQFNKATAKLTAEEIMALMHEPIEMSVPTSHTMKTAIEEANEEEKKEKEKGEEAEKEKIQEPEEEVKKTNSTPAKAKKAVNNTAKTKRQSSRNKPEEKDKEETQTPEDNTETNADAIVEQNQEEQNKDKDLNDKTNDADAEEKEKEVVKDKKEKKNTKDSKGNKEEDKSKDKEKDKTSKDKNSKDKSSKDTESSRDKSDTEAKESEVKEKTPEKSVESTDDSKKDGTEEEEKKENSKESSKETEKEKSTEKSHKEEKKEEKDKSEDEPRAKRSRESKKTEPPPRSPNKRKSKF